MVYVLLLSIVNCEVKNTNFKDRGKIDKSNQRNLSEKGVRNNKDIKSSSIPKF